MSRSLESSVQRSATRERRASDDHAEAAPALAVQASPGVGTTSLQAMMAAGGNRAMVQLAGGGDGGPEAVHAAAARGVAGGGGALPHLAAIQRSFGAEHDVSGVKAHVGGAAAEASQAMGAEAYATGSDVAFAKDPTLHTAAHEAAHVVQQRGGVQLKGGVGEAGDPYERHADAVADRVVAGQSAGDLLAGHGKGGGGSSGGVQHKLVQREGKTTPKKTTTPPAKTTGQTTAPATTGPEAKASSGPKITVSETTAFDFGLSIPIYGPVKLEGKVGGSYTTKDGADGKKTEVEGMLYGGILIDLWIVKLRAGIEGKVKFTVDGHEGLLEAVKKGINEIAQWKIAKDFQPKLVAARSTMQYAFANQVQGFSNHHARVLAEVRKGNYKTAADWWYFGTSPREWAIWYAEGWNRSLTDRFEGLGAEIVTANLVNVEKLEALFDKIKTAKDKAQAEKFASNAHAYGINELARTYNSALKALDQVQVVKNDPKVGFEASIAFKAGISVQATSTVGAEIEVAAVSSIEDKEGESKWDTGTQDATVVSGKLTIGTFEVGLSGNWKPEDVEITGSFTKSHSTAPPEAAEHSVGGVMSAVKGASSAFQLLASPGATTRAVVQELGKVVQSSTKDLTDPAKIAERLKGQVNVGQSIGVEVTLKFKRQGFKLKGGGVKVTLTAMKIDAQKALGAAGSVGVSGSVSKGASFEASWGE